MADSQAAAATSSRPRTASALSAATPLRQPPPSTGSHHIRTTGIAPTQGHRHEKRPMLPSAGGRPHFSPVRGSERLTRSTPTLRNAHPQPGGVAIRYDAVLAGSPGSVIDSYQRLPQPGPPAPSVGTAGAFRPIRLQNQLNQNTEPKGANGQGRRQEEAARVPFERRCARVFSSLLR